MFKQAQSTAQTIRFTKKARRAILTTIIMAPVALGVTAAAAEALAPSANVPERTIVQVESAAGNIFEFDAKDLVDPGIVTVDGSEVNFNLERVTVSTEGWQLTRFAIDPASPIQAYKLSPAD